MSSFLYLWGSSRIEIRSMRRLISPARGFLERVRIEALVSKKSAVGRRVTFTCTAYQGDSTKFSWTRNGKIIQHGADRFVISTNDGNSMLTIGSVTSEDSGDFTCIASNEVSEDRSTAHLTVEGD